MKITGNSHYYEWLFDISGFNEVMEPQQIYFIGRIRLHFDFVKHGNYKQYIKCNAYLDILVKYHVLTV